MPKLIPSLSRKHFNNVGESVGVGTFLFLVFLIVSATSLIGRFVLVRAVNLNICHPSPRKKNWLCRHCRRKSNQTHQLGEFWLAKTKSSYRTYIEVYVDRLIKCCVGTVGPASSVPTISHDWDWHVDKQVRRKCWQRWEYVD